MGSLWIPKSIQNYGGSSNLAEPLIFTTSWHRSQKILIPMRINNLCPGVESGVGIVGPKNCPILPGVRNRKMLIPMGFWQFCVGGEAYSAKGLKPRRRQSLWVSGSFVWEGGHILPRDGTTKMPIPMGFWQFCLGKGLYSARGWKQEDANPYGFLAVLCGRGVIFCRGFGTGRR